MIRQIQDVETEMKDGEIQEKQQLEKINQNENRKISESKKLKQNIKERKT